MTNIQKSIYAVRRYLLTIAVFTLLPCICHSSTIIRQTETGAKYDVARLPITARELKKRMMENQHDPVAMLQLIRGAAYSKLAFLAFETVKSLSQKQPDNAVLLASCPYAYDIASNFYGGYDRSLDKDEKHYVLTRKDQDYCEMALAKAEKIEPYLWLPYAIQGYRTYGFAQTPQEVNQHIALLEKAIKLQPDISYPHYLLAKMYLAGPPYRSYPKAERELQLAVHSKPVIADAAFRLFQLYDSWLPNPVKAKLAVADFLASLPPNVTISPVTRARLDKYK